MDLFMNLPLTLQASQLVIEYMVHVHLKSVKLINLGDMDLAWINELSHRILVDQVGQVSKIKVMGYAINRLALDTNHIGQVRDSLKHIWSNLTLDTIWFIRLDWNSLKTRVQPQSRILVH